jgi:TolB protein
LTFANNIGNAEIFVINSDGTGLTQLTNNTEFDNAKHFAEPSINYDGSKIVFSYDSQSGGEIFVVNSDGTGLKQVTDFKTGPGCSEPAISGDGSKIAFRLVDFTTWNRGIFVVNSDDTKLKQLTDSDYFDEQPSISYDGSKIAFLGADDFDFQYFVINSDGTGLTKLTQNSNKFQDVNNPSSIPPSGPSISDDGSKVAFEGYVGEDTEIFVVNSDGTGMMQLTDNAENDWAPAISGDGSRIVFQRSTRQQQGIGEMQIFVINSDGTGLTKLTDDSERSFSFPSISDNGERIAFWSSFYRNPESESDFEYEVGISLVSYQSESEDENSAEPTFPVAIVVGGVLPAAVGVMILIYLKKKPGKL